MEIIYLILIFTFLLFHSSKNQFKFWKAWVRISWYDSVNQKVHKIIQANTNYKNQTIIFTLN